MPILGEMHKSMLQDELMVQSLLAAVTGGIAALVWGIQQAYSAPPAEQLSSATQGGGPEMKEAVIVLGSTGKLGRQIVAQVTAEP